MAHMAYWLNIMLVPTWRFQLLQQRIPFCNDVTRGLRKAQAPNACTQLQHGRPGHIRF